MPSCNTLFLPPLLSLLLELLFLILLLYLAAIEVEE
jgi:hypothetical protein